MTRYGEWMNVRIAALRRGLPEPGVLGGLAGRVGPAARVADEDLEGLAAQLVGARQRTGDQPLADQDMGPDRVPECGVVGHARTLAGAPARHGDAHAGGGSPGGAWDR